MTVRKLQDGFKRARWLRILGDTFAAFADKNSEDGYFASYSYIHGRRCVGWPCDRSMAPIQANTAQTNRALGHRSARLPSVLTSGLLSSTGRSVAGRKYQSS